jgi:peptidyl-prolyl cis-trans isomerase A (cyclophilin A)
MAAKIQNKCDKDALMKSRKAQPKSWHVIFGALVALGSACKSSPPEPEPRAEPEQTPTKALASATADDAQRQRLQEVLAKRQQPGDGGMRPDGFGRKAHAGSPKQPESGSDPVGGKFTLEDATKGLPASGQLIAEIHTEHGKLSCELYDDKAPTTVANFVGLARGLRPFKDPTTGEWVKRPAYNGTVFHRIIKGFMIQGGDPTGTGRGEPGYVIPDEIWVGAKHDQRGLICMANRGPNTNGMQFFIMDGAKEHLDGGYTIFGKCGPDTVIEKLASSETMGDRAVNPPKMERITVSRVPKKK